ncbi:MAG: c-type cytochrome [Caulobacter sp.]|nr:c-type cytochrome [Caulobacter sp.]
MKYPLMLAVLLVGMAASAASAQTSGQQVFEQKCTMCHSLQPAPGKMGPPLAGVVGRKAATAPGFAYSTALKGSNITWSNDQLDAFIKAPGKTVPGTKMLLGEADAAKRAAVIQYLSSVKK